MNAEDYNRRQIERQALGVAEITRLVEFYQVARELETDGKAGPVTLADLRALFALEGPAPTRAPTDLARVTLAHALAMIGEGEEGGNNSGPFVEMLHGKDYDGDPDDDGNWCAAFISEAIARACGELGIEMPFQRTGGAKALYKRAGRVGLCSSDPAPAIWSAGIAANPAPGPATSRSWRGWRVERMETPSTPSRVTSGATRPR
jgi:hypothetical protein